MTAMTKTRPFDIAEWLTDDDAALDDKFAEQGDIFGLSDQPQ